MKRKNRLIWLGAIAIILMTIMIIVPPNDKINNGSTFNRNPDGYGAWYAFMEKKGTKIQRWQKPFNQLPTNQNQVTLLQINSSLLPPVIDNDQTQWLEKGNNLVILGVVQPVSASEFSTLQTSPFGNVKIETRRRRKTSSSEQVALGDQFGAVVWQEKRGKGTVTYATTPYIAANAYQDETANFQYLADLVTKNSTLLYVDEYIHNYKDSDVKAAQGEADIFSYFAKTPLFSAFVQLCILLLVLIWAKNRRFGQLTILETPVIDNSQAYIQALASVLQKAQATDFVVEMVGKEEQIQLQKTLGLGQAPIENQILLEVWKEKNSNNTAELLDILKLQSQKRRISESELISWLEKWQTLRRIKN
ncbi:MAG TPA: DUF4350 domain-containing protein [Nostocaceae cyanobacterium]|nr:DUF4350 domain-containing protein [Nostocaceae cyanobacterium]